MLKCVWWPLAACLLTGHAVPLATRLEVEGVAAVTLVLQESFASRDVAVVVYHMPQNHT